MPLAAVTVATGTRDPRKQPASDFRYIDVSSVSNETYRITTHSIIAGKDAPSRARKVVRAGDTIFATVRPYLRNIAQVPQELDNSICSTGFCVIRANPQQADPGFLYFAVLTDEFINNVVAKQKGSSYPAVTDKEVLAQVIPLPPLAEQRRIAAVLTTLQDAIAGQEDVIAAARTFKRSLMHRLFTYGPAPVPAETKETEIGEIPAHWELQRVEDIALKPQYGFTASATWKDTGVRFLRITDITDSGVLWSSVPFCDWDEGDAQKYGLQDDDIVFARTGATTGKSYLVRGCPRAVFASYLIRLRVKPGIMPDYLYHYFNTDSYWQQVSLNKTGATQPGINGTKLAELLVPVPGTKSEQSAVSQFLNTMDAKIAAEEDRKTALETLFKSMLHQLMTGRLRLRSDEGLPLPG